MTNRIPTGKEAKERLVNAAIKDVLDKGESNIKYCNASKIARELRMPSRTVRHLIRNDKEIAVIAEISLKDLSNEIQDLRIKLSDILDEKLSDDSEISKMSLYQATKSYGLIIDKEILLTVDKYVKKNNIMNFQITKQK